MFEWYLSVGIGGTSLRASQAMLDDAGPGGHGWQAPLTGTDTLTARYAQCCIEPNVSKMTPCIPPFDPIPLFITLLLFTHHIVERRIFVRSGFLPLVFPLVESCSSSCCFVYPYFGQISSPGSDMSSPLI